MKIEEKRIIRSCVDRLTQLTQDRLKVLYDRRSLPGTKGEVSALHLALVRKKVWPTGSTLRIRFLDGPSSVQQRVVEHAMKWTQHANIRFDFVESNDADIRISFIFDPDKSWSWLGTDARAAPSNEPTMNFGWLDEGTPDAEYERVVLHEFGHALGCIHEHSNPLGGGVPWDRPAAIEYYKGSPNFWDETQIEVNVFFRYSVDAVEGTFDPNSIMMYPIPNSITIGDFEVAGGATLTPNDIEVIKKLYPKDVPNMETLAINGDAFSASIAAPKEYDTYQFVVAEEGDYRIETFGPTDVIMVLSGPDDMTKVIDEDDESGTEEGNARIQSRLRPGRYFARVHHFDERRTGPYKISVKRG